MRRGGGNGAWRSVQALTVLAAISGSGEPALAAPDEERPRVVFGSDHDFPPYEWLDDRGVPRGFNVDLIRAIADAAGFDVEVRLGPWSAIRQAFDRDRTVDVVDMYFSEERARAYRFTTPFSAINDMLFARRDSVARCEPSRLRGCRVLVQRASYAAEYLRSLELGVEIVFAGSEPDALLRLAAGDADCALVSESPGRYILARDGLTGLVGVGPPISPRPYAFVVMLDREDLAVDIERGLAQVKADGRFGAIYDRWFGQRKPSRLARLGRPLAAAVGILAVILAVILAWSRTLRRKVASQTSSLQEQLRALTSAQDALRETEARYRTLVEHAPEAILVYDAERDQFVDANANASAMLGLSRDEILARGPRDISAAKQNQDQPAADAWREHLDDALARAGRPFEWVFRGPDDASVLCELRLVELPGAESKHIRVSAVDIRNRRMLEEQLQQAQRLESLGRLAGGIAHDFNNLLTVVMSQAYRLEHQLRGNPLAAAATDVRQAANRAATLTRQLLAFSRHQILQPRAVEVSSLIGDMERLLGRLLGEQVELSTDLRSGEATVRADPGQLEQVVLNLVINARDAMPHGGRIELRAHAFEAAGADSEPELPEGRYVVIEVADAGTGMTAEVQARVFEPFYTTKGTGRGTGLGLATVYGIVKQSGGHITVASTVGRGSTFRVFLPECDEPAPARRVAPAVTETTDAVAGKLLLVEDDAQLRAVLTGGLQRRGFDVLSAADSRQALGILDEEEQVDLLITDVVMPGMSGIELARAVDALPNPPRVLFISGYAEDESSRAELSKAGREVLTKPFHVHALVQRVRELLESAN